MVFTVVIGVVVTWFVVALALALLIGRAVALGERSHRRAVSTRPALEPVRRTAELVI